MSFQLFHFTEETAGDTLAGSIKKLLECKTWGDARKVVSQRRVQINGNLCLDPARRLTSKDVVKVWDAPLPRPIEPRDLKLVYVDDDIIVVEKPAGITSVRHFEEKRMKQKRKQLQPTLEELMPIALAAFLRNRRFESRLEERRQILADPDPEAIENLDLPLANLPKKKRNPAIQREANERLAARLNVIAVHRLDRDTSGLMIFARTRRAALILGEAFRKHAIDRRYMAVVKGHPPAQTFDSHFVRDRGDGRRGSVSESIPDVTQHAITHIRPLEVIGPYSIVECKLETGRTHQIRIHLSEAGFPLCGDNVYNRKLNGPMFDDKSGAPRQALHSYALRFVHPITGEIHKYLMPWPKDLQAWINKLKSK